MVGAAGFLRHCAALHGKNITVAKRDRRATLTQLFASFFFMLFVSTLFLSLYRRYLERERERERQQQQQQVFSF
jgi:preprotein translocase subunit SecG